jgi:hypothetical protein
MTPTLMSHFFCCNEEGDGSKVVIAFCFHFVALKKVIAFSFGLSAANIYIFLLFGFVVAKKATTMSRCPLLWFRCSEQEEEDNFCHLL